MKKNLYRMAYKPEPIPFKRRPRFDEVKAEALPQPVAVDKFTECHVTPPDVARRMVRYLGPVGDYQTLEPSAGTGNLVQALLDSGHSANELTMIERHINLAAGLYKFKGGVINRCFLEYAAEAVGKVEFPRVIMNPPFKDVRKHIRAARSLLGSNGHDCPPVLVALVPVTFEAEGMETLETLGPDTFATARVLTKIVRFND
jgi:hypothetical protein